MTATRISDIIVPEIFSPYTRTLTEQKSRLIRSGAVVSDPVLVAALAGGGLTFNEPSFQDLADDAENISTDDPAVFSTPYGISTQQEIQVRLSRNNSWSTMNLAATLAGADPQAAIADRVSDYWVRRMQDVFVATMTGVFADNAAAPAGGDTHTQDDMTNDISNGGVFSDGTTNFSAEAFLDAAVTMGDSMEDLTMIMVHSIVYNRMLKNNLIDFVSDSVNGNAVRVPTFLGRTVIIDDQMPVATNVFESWIFGAGSLRWGAGSPPVPTETERLPSAGTGGGQDVLYNRVEWCLHPVGYQYAGTAANGGPSNAATANNLANAGSWSRCFAERKQIKIARLITTEFA